MSRDRTLTVGAVLLLLFTLPTAAVAEDGPGGFKGKHRPSPNVLVMKPYRDTIQRMTRVVAHVDAYREAMVLPMVTGKVQGEPVEEGTRVNIGTELCTLDVPDLVAAHATATSMVAEIVAKEAELAAAVTQVEQEVAEAEAVARQAAGAIGAAEAGLEKAEAEKNYKQVAYDRLMKALEGSPNLVVQGKVDDAKGQLRVAEANVKVAGAEVSKARDEVAVANARVTAAGARVTAAEAVAEAAAKHKLVAQNRVAEAQVRLDFATVKSPIAGVVVKRTVDTGAVVKPGSGKSMFHIVNDDTLRVWFSLATPDAPHCRPGSKVVLVFSELKDPKTGLAPYRLTTAITRVTDALDPVTRTMKAEVQLPNPTTPKGRRILRAGMFCRAEVSLETIKNALILPTRAVSTKKHKSSVKIVKPGEGNVVRKISVEIGVDDGARIQILSEELEGSLVIIKGGGLVADGEKANPTETQPGK